MSLPDELRAALRSNNKALPDINGDDSWELPLPATYVLAPDRKIALAEIELDYRERLEPDAIVAALRALRSDGRPLRHPNGPPAAMPPRPPKALLAQG